jgi:hypothetical protein
MTVAYFNATSRDLRVIRDDGTHAAYAWLPHDAPIAASLAREGWELAPDAMWSDPTGTAQWVAPVIPLASLAAAAAAAESSSAELADDAPATSPPMVAIAPTALPILELVSVYSDAGELETVGTVMGYTHEGYVIHANNTGPAPLVRRWDRVTRYVPPASDV